MSFHTHNDREVPIDGTFLVGSIQAQRRHLVAAFGEPIAEGDESRINFEWRLQFDDGLVATIYDWKVAPSELDDVVIWRIGGRSVHAIARVHEAFRSARRDAA